MALLAYHKIIKEYQGLETEPNKRTILVVAPFIFFIAVTQPADVSLNGPNYSGRSPSIPQIQDTCIKSRYESLSTID